MPPKITNQIYQRSDGSHYTRCWTNGRMWEVETHPSQIRKEHSHLWRPVGHPSDSRREFSYPPIAEKEDLWLRYH